MDDLESNERDGETARLLVGWSIGSAGRQSLVLGLEYVATPDNPGARRESLQVVLPREAALYLSEELERQARMSLSGLTG